MNPTLSLIEKVIPSDSQKSPNHYGLNSKILHNKISGHAFHLANSQRIFKQYQNVDPSVALESRLFEL